MELSNQAVDAAFPDLPPLHSIDNIESLHPAYGRKGEEASDAEAALEALRAAINSNIDDEFPPSHPASPPGTVAEAEARHHVGSVAVKIVQKVEELSRSIEETGEMLQNMERHRNLLLQSNKRQMDIVKQILSDLTDSDGQAFIDPTLYLPSRADFDDLQARYDALVATQPGHKKKKSKKETQKMVELPPPESITPPIDGRTPSGRKKRSLKLEHLVHKMANRRLGVEYLITHFEARGTRDLPPPGSVPPSAEESINQVQEFRPDFRADVAHPSVRPFLDQVWEDVVYDWENGVGIGEPDVDREKIREAVGVYWVRLGKRYDEQMARERGEVHKDEIIRRKQNQYRRQQSLLARRTAAFDNSPLNQCRFRSLYRTLLTIDFAPATNDRPDPSRAYSEDEWNAYRKVALGSKGADAHEIIDQFWVSPAVRSLLNLLDVSATDQIARARRKGRPKAPAPTFHLPSSLWDRTSLPLIRPKDSQGLPMSGAPGLILFKFHVDPQVQRDNPEWAEGLYDTPPIPDSDALFPSLSEVMSSARHQHLIIRAQIAKQAADVTPLGPEEIQDVLNRTEEMDMDPDGSFELVTDGGEATEGLSTLVDIQELGPPSIGDGQIVGPSPGSSVRARKQAKRSAAELPGGAAMPVAKRLRDDETGDEGGELEVIEDVSFLGI